MPEYEFQCPACSRKWSRIKRVAADYCCGQPAVLLVSKPADRPDMTVRENESKAK